MSLYLSVLYAKANNRWIIYMDGQINNSDWIKDTYQFNKGFRKKYNEEIDKGYSLEVGIQYNEKLHELYNDLPFLLE